MGGSRQQGDDDGGGRMRPRYLTLQAPSPPAPNGHRFRERRTAYGVHERESARARPQRGRLMLALLAVAGVLLGLATALLAWVLWRLAMAGG